MTAAGGSLADVPPIGSRRSRSSTAAAVDQEPIEIGAGRRGTPRVTADDALRSALEVAGRQWGQASTAQLRAAGLDWDRCAALRRRGLLHPRHADVWALGPDARTPRADLMAAVLAGGDDALAADGAAAWLWGWRPRFVPPATVVVPRGRRRGRDDVAFSVRDIPDADRTHQLGIPVTTPARTVVDCAPRLEPAALDRLVNDALISPYLTLGRLHEQLAASTGRPGVRALRDVLQLVEEGFTRSEAEARLRALNREAGFDGARYNERIAGRERDCVWHDLKLVVEVMGFAFHTTPRAFEDDLRRDLSLSALGWHVHPISYRMLRDEPLRTAVQLGQVIARLRAGGA